MLWPPKIVRYHIVDFFLWGLIQRYIVPPMPTNITDVRKRIIAMEHTIDRPMLIRVWQELYYGLLSMELRVDAKIL